MFEWGERFGAAEPVGLSGVPWLSKSCGSDFGDVGRIDQSCRCGAKRCTYDIACVQLITPTQHIGLEGAWAKNRPGKSCSSLPPAPRDEKAHRQQHHVPAAVAGSPRPR
jgi:hypothetical protein